MSISAPISSPALPKLLMADDHHLILDALQAIMKNDYEIRAVDSSEAFMNAAEEFQPDVAILDVSMPGPDGFVTARKILERRPALPIIFLSMYAEPSYRDRAAQVGAKAYLSKQAPAQELVSALRTVLDGGSLMTPASRSLQDATASETGTGELTSRQREVLRLIAAAGTAKDIANELNISVRTAEFHRAAIMQRLGLRSTAQMTRYAITNHLA